MPEQPLLPPDANPEARRAAVYLVMAQIPPGKVVSYGELAAKPGHGRQLAIAHHLAFGNLRHHQIDGGTACFGIGAGW